MAVICYAFCRAIRANFVCLSNTCKSANKSVRASFKLARFLQIAKISSIFKEAKVLPQRLPHFGKANNFGFLTINCENNFGRLVQFAMAGQNHFYPVHLMLFTVISIETRNMSNIFIQVLVTRTLDLVTGRDGMTEKLLLMCSKFRLVFPPFHFQTGGLPGHCYGSWQHLARSRP